MRRDVYGNPFVHEKRQLSEPHTRATLLFHERNGTTSNKEGLWEVVTKENLQDADKNEWNSKNIKAKALIGLLVVDSQLIYIRKLEAAKEYWTALRNHHEKSRFLKQSVIFKKSCRVKLDVDRKMENYLNKMTQIVDKLARIGQNSGENLIVTFMLSSLPESYDTIMVLEIRLVEKLTIETVQEKLI
ncbi:hypothetical protein ILUMI_09315 [Ignelater luminosus]|uniref:Retrovirus-related Pol polyprotein from transposon TNT 1-94 n=1 Tax=Ignelater luminosus TaxID=2038154 RepID=A0A8K0D437_IGNLU|nr:hypothetical protein ILUMI_09315 [Ignelater luminosus]